MFSSLQNELMKAGVSETGLVSVMASEEDDEAVRS